MDTHGPHSIIPERELSGLEAKRFMPLTSEEAEKLSGMDAKSRETWLKDRLPTKERLAMHLESLGHDDLAANARRGDYSDFESEVTAMPQHLLLEHMTGRKGEDEVRAAVLDGWYDDTPKESEVWASKQTGEMKRIIDAMGKGPMTPAERTLYEAAKKRAKRR